MFDIDNVRNHKINPICHRSFRTVYTWKKRRKNAHSLLHPTNTHFSFAVGNGRCNGSSVRRPITRSGSSNGLWNYSNFVVNFKRLQQRVILQDRNTLVTDERNAEKSYLFAIHTCEEVEGFFELSMALLATTLWAE